eukprot:Colp12_sorted_trinity150504_noHs@11131
MNAYTIRRKQSVAPDTLSITSDVYAPCIFLVVLLLACIKLGLQAEEFEGIHVKEWYHSDFAPFAGYCMFAHFFILVVSRSLNRGIAGFYDGFWACNFSLLLCGAGIFLRSPMIVGTTLALLAFEHLTFFIDLCCYFTMSKFPIGSAAYLMWPSTPWHEWLTTSHHLWFIPFCFGVLYRSGGLYMSCWVLSCVVSTGLMLLGRYTIPRVIRYKGAELYLNINMGHEFTKDIPVAFLHWFDKHRGPVYMPWILFVGNVVVNLPCFLLLRLMSYLLL